MDGGFSETHEMSDAQNRIFNSFYALISERSKAKLHAFDMTTPQILENDTPTANKGANDFLESQGVFFGCNVQIERVARGLAQRLAICVSQRENSKWGILKATDLDFIVSDQYQTCSR